MRPIRWRKEKGVDVSMDIVCRVMKATLDAERRISRNNRSTSGIGNRG